MSSASVTAKIGSTPYTVTLTNERTHQWLADEPRDSQGSDAGPTPTELLLSSLGACTAITLRMYAAHKGWPLEDVRVHLQFNPQGVPATGGSDIERQVTLSGALSAQQRERLLAVANACPIHKVLSGQIRISTRLESAGAGAG